jgi:hypothetical protein
MRRTLIFNRRGGNQGMSKNLSYVVGFTLALVLISSFAVAQQANPAAYPGQQPGWEKNPKNFFITSVGMGKGGDLGGLAGADRHCQALATAAGLDNRTWHAYLSTQAANGQPAVNARDRIGNGPWYNVKGVMIAKNLSDLHGDTLDSARLGNLISKIEALTEKGAIVKGLEDDPNQHDMLTGSKLDGTAYTDDADHTCHNWTSSSDGHAQLGHSDRNSFTSISWNSAHPSRNCSQEGLVSTGGAGMFYCFGIN